MPTRESLIRAFTAAIGDKSKKTHRERAEACVNALVYAVHDDLNASGVSRIPELCKIEMAKRNQRQGRNPKTGEALTIPEHWAFKISALKPLRDLADEKPLK